ncbi:Glycosyl hydrolase family 53 [Paenibacillus sp. cl141a]|nr:Glycosyl hydrolase family 53 [Paenibacillus sp. cl141a]
MGTGCNETNNGMLWEDGKASANMKNYAWLVNTGHNTVKTVSGQAKTIVHLSNGYDNELFKWNLGGLISNGANFDIIGMSLYPEAGDWSSKVDQTIANAKDMTARYGKSIMISEIGMDWKALKTERF